MGDVKQEPPKDEPRDWSIFEAPLPVNNNPARGAKELEVQTNLFQVSLEDMKKVYKYRIEMFKSTADDSVEKELTTGIRTDFALQNRRRVNTSLFLDLISFSQKQGTPLTTDKYHIVYDCGNIFYTLDPYCGPMTYELTLADISSSNTKSHLGNRFTKVKVNIQAIGEIHPKNTNLDNREIVQFIELLTSALVNRQQEHFVFKNRTYCKSSRKDTDIKEGKVVKSGNQKNCRVVDQNGSSMMLQIDAKKSPFFESISLVEFARRFLNLQRCEDLLRARINVKQLNTQLKDLWVKTNSKDMKSQTFSITKIDGKLNSDNYFVTYDGQEVSVSEYFERKYKMQLKYKNLPLVVQKKGAKSLHFPMEILDIERGQRVATAKSTPTMVERMIKECQLKPCNLMDNIHEQMKVLSLTPDSGNKYLQAFGVRIGSRPEVVPAKVLYPPTIVYKNKLVEPNRDGGMNWRLATDSFYSSVEMKEPWLIIVFDRCATDDEATRFARELTDRANKMNMRISANQLTVIGLPSERDDLIDQTFQEAKQKKVRFIGAITSHKLDPVHNTLKFLEAKYSIVTQHVSKQTMTKAIGQQGSFMVLGNLVSKTNPKLGGVNHVFELAKPYKQSNPSDTSSNERLLSKNRMFIGLDVGHAGAQASADRQLGMPSSEPTVVGMSYSVKVPTEMRGMFWFQESRLATVSRLAKYGFDALQDYCKSTKNYPEEIIIFRSGASEGEYGKVEQEVKEFSQCFAEISKVQGRNYNPSVTTVVCQTSSNYRMIPTRINPGAKPCDQNVPPGTVVDCDIVNPNLDEFILIPQKAIQGTARVIKCTVVYRKKGNTGTILSCSDLQNLTNILSYGHQTVTGSTGVPCHVYAAANLAKRGRNNWKAANYNDCDLASEVSGGSGGKLQHDGSPDYFEKLTEQLASELKTHFWA
ncbi:unnamed protein product [Auanema sp. JU1783]|nr:unnamed protein product [Auanema sp. JU1783]